MRQDLNYMNWVRACPSAELIWCFWLLEALLWEDYSWVWAVTPDEGIGMLVWAKSRGDLQKEANCKYITLRKQITFAECLPCFWQLRSVSCVLSHLIHLINVYLEAKIWEVSRLQINLFHHSPVFLSSRKNRYYPHISEKDKTSHSTKIATDQ